MVQDWHILAQAYSHDDHAFVVYTHVDTSMWLTAHHNICCAAYGRCIVTMAFSNVQSSAGAINAATGLPVLSSPPTPMTSPSGTTMERTSAKSAAVPVAKLPNGYVDWDNLHRSSILSWEDIKPEVYTHEKLQNIEAYKKLADDGNFGCKSREIIPHHNFIVALAGLEVQTFEKC